MLALATINIMKSTYKYGILYISFFIILIAFMVASDSMRKTSIEFQKQILLKEAQTHFSNQQNTRKWNSMYGGLYAKPLKNQDPNPFLQNNSLKVDENLTLIKINPAWMTRQLSELSDMKEFSFRITSLDPINPDNKANKFETKALEYIAKTNETEYYELSKDGKFNYMGGLVTTKSCLPCHQHQGYTIGDLRGGISISLNTSEYDSVVADIEMRMLIIRSFTLFFLLSIMILIHKQIASNEKLQNKVKSRTQEIESTKKLLQQILDGDLSFLIVANDDAVIFTNKTVLDFFEISSVEEFNTRYPSISDMFEKTDNKEFLQKYMDDEHWTQYLKREQNNKDIKVIIKKDGANRYFRPHTKEIIIDEQRLYLIIFDDITREYQKMQKLEESASLDPLTQLFNRGKFESILSKEIDLSKTTKSPISIIFLDIDHFKKINDTYGHDVGDEVLIEIANLLKSDIRKGDFVFRWGGEEFVVTLHSANRIQASILAEKIRKSVEMHNFKSVPSQTISLGVAQYRDGEDQITLLKRADEALYEAKSSGRNRVVSKI